MLDTWWGPELLPGDTRPLLTPPPPPPPPTALPLAPPPFPCMPARPLLDCSCCCLLVEGMCCPPLKTFGAGTDMDLLSGPATREAGISEGRCAGRAAARGPSLRRDPPSRRRGRAGASTRSIAAAIEPLLQQGSDNGAFNCATGKSQHGVRENTAEHEHDPKLWRTSFEKCQTKSPLLPIKVYYSVKYCEHGLQQKP